MMSDRDVSLQRSVCFQLAITPVLVQTCIPFYKQPLIANDFRLPTSRPENIMGSCFVIMGFGEKIDFQSSPHRVLNLNRTYEDIIKPVVLEAGHTCVRADETIHRAWIEARRSRQRRRIVLNRSNEGRGLVRIGSQGRGGKSQDRDCREGTPAPDRGRTRWHRRELDGGHPERPVEEAG
jgi:hypothetical protein